MASKKSSVSIRVYLWLILLLLFSLSLHAEETTPTKKDEPFFGLFSYWGGIGQAYNELDDGESYNDTILSFGCMPMMLGGINVSLSSAEESEDSIRLVLPLVFIERAFNEVYGNYTQVGVFFSFFQYSTYHGDIDLKSELQLDYDISIPIDDSPWVYGVEIQQNVFYYDDEKRAAITLSLSASYIRKEQNDGISIALVSRWNNGPWFDLEDYGYSRRIGIAISYINMNKELLGGARDLLTL